MWGLSSNPPLLCVFLGVWTSSCIHCITGQGIKTSCKAPSVYMGDPATVTCLFSEDINKTRKGDFRVYRYDSNQNGVQTEVTVLDCYWRDEATCRTAPMYFFDGVISDNLTISMPSATEEFMGRYECQVEPADLKDVESCVFALKYGVKPQPSSTASVLLPTRESSTKGAGIGEPREQDQPAEGGSNAAAIVVPIILVIIIVCVVVAVYFFRDRIQKRFPNFPLLRIREHLRADDAESARYEKDERETLVDKASTIPAKERGPEENDQSDDEQEPFVDAVEDLDDTMTQNIPVRPERKKRSNNPIASADRDDQPLSPVQGDTLVEKKTSQAAEDGTEDKVEDAQVSSHSDETSGDSTPGHREVKDGSGVTDQRKQDIRKDIQEEVPAQTPLLVQTTEVADETVQKENLGKDDPAQKFEALEPDVDQQIKQAASEAETAGEDDENLKSLQNAEDLGKKEGEETTNKKDEKQTRLSYRRFSDDSIAV